MNRSQASLVAAAIALRLPVFPCGANKKPAIPKSEQGRGFLDASREPAAIERLFSHRGAQLIGVPTGAASGFDVLDIDPRHGGDAWLAANVDCLPPTRTHTTRSGGSHIFFRHADGVRNTESKIASGVDTRGEGGYIIWWPADGCPVASSTNPQEWPSWLLTLLLPKPVSQIIARPPMILASDTHARRLVQRCLERVSRASPGQRHYELRSAAYTIGGVLGQEIGKDEAARALLSAIQAAGGADVDDKNALSTIQSGLERGAAAPIRVS